MSPALSVIGFDRGDAGLSLVVTVSLWSAQAMDCSGQRAYFSFKPLPTPAPLLWTVIVASSKLHEEAADTKLAPASAITGVISCVHRIFLDRL